MKCKWHVCTNEIVVGKRPKQYCSRVCAVKEAVTRKRRELKRKAVELLGGRCELCGYSRCVQALQFHHKFGDKEFGIAAHGRIRGWAAMQKELKKCVLICANCHAEEHAKTIGICVTGV